MSEMFLEKKDVVSSEPINVLVSCVNKKIWQTPKLAIIDYSETKGGLDDNDDGAGWS
jgi:hypothetical protein